jgi:tetratricopeptide (TPR) repeat protein
MDDQEARIPEALAIANGLNVQGSLLIRQGKYKEANTFLEEGLSTLQGLPQWNSVKQLEGALRGNLGQSHFQMGDIKRAVELFERQVELAKEVDDPHSGGNAISGLAMCLAAVGQLDQAEQLFLHRLSMTQAMGDKVGEGNTMNSLANLYLQRKHHGPAIAMLRKRIELARAVKDARGEATSLLNLATVYRDTSRVKEARKTLRETIDLMRRNSDPRLPQAESEMEELGEE